LGAAKRQEEVCSSCGDYVTYIAPSTGWCIKCTLEHFETIGPENDFTCERCTNSTDQSHKLCRSCRHEAFLEKHADEIDLCLANGISVTGAIQLIRNNEMIHCKLCGTPMRKASNGINFFCTTNKECRTAHRRMKYYIYDKGFNKTAALEKVLEVHNNRIQK
jgi:hypothetical protein